MAETTKRRGRPRTDPKAILNDPRTLHVIHLYEKDGLTLREIGKRLSPPVTYETVRHIIVKWERATSQKILRKHSPRSPKRNPSSFPGRSRTENFGAFGMMVIIVPLALHDKIVESAREKGYSVSAEIKNRIEISLREDRIRRGLVRIENEIGMTPHFQEDDHHDDKKVPIGFSARRALRERIERLADYNCRPMAHEIVARLWTSFEGDEILTRLKRIEQHITQNRKDD